MPIAIDNCKKTHCHTNCMLPSGCWRGTGVIEWVDLLQMKWALARQWKSFCTVSWASGLQAIMNMSTIIQRHTWQSILWLWLCNSQKSFLLLCMCLQFFTVFSAQNLRATHGPTLLVVPPSLILTWITEWSNAVSEEDTAMLIIGHHQLSNGLGLQAYGHRNVYVNWFFWIPATANAIGW